MTALIVLGVWIVFGAAVVLTIRRATKRRRLIDEQEEKGRRELRIVPKDAA